MTATPFKGLIPYGEDDAPFFFGREHERAIISANLLAARLTLLYGQSGVGKSSVLRAGVVHELRELARQNLAERGEPDFAVLAYSSWRDDPVVGLTAAVYEAYSATLNSLHAQPEPQRAFGGLIPLFEAWTKRARGDLLIILDQFEEYFLYHDGEDGDGTFAVEFPRAVNRADLRVNFIVSLREDALSKLDRFKGRVPNLFDNYLRIEHLTREAARDAIEKPIAEYNRRLSNPADAVSIEPALVDEVLAQVQTGRVTLGRGGRGVVASSALRQAQGADIDARIETPYLQLVMTRLWDEEMRAGSHTLRLETLTRLKGAENIVRTHLDAVMDALTPAERDIAAEMFRYLVTPTGTKIAYTVADLAAYSKTDRAALAAVLEKLAGSELRILRTVEPPPDHPTESRYEIFHDVLAAAILDWRARYTQDRDQRELEARKARELADAQQRQSLAFERQNAQRLRLGLAILFVFLLISLGLAVYAFQQQQQAQAHAEEALAHAEEAQALATSAAQVAEIALTQSGSDSAARATIEALATSASHVIPTSTPTPFDPKQPTATSSPTASPTLFAITNIAPRVDPLVSSNCPVTFTFSADITVDHGGFVDSIWELSDGRTLTSNRLFFKGAGTDRVSSSTTYNFSFDGTARLHITAPLDSLSQELRFTAACTSQQGQSGVPSPFPVFTPPTPTRTPTATPTPIATRPTPPAGTLIVFESNRANGFNHLFTMDWTGGNVRRLTFDIPDSDTEFHADVLPGSTWLAFAARVRRVESDKRVQSLFRSRLDGSDLIRLTFDENGEAELPRWSPDGAQIAYKTSLNPPIILMASTGQQKRSTANGDPSDHGPSWALDKIHLAFDSARGAQHGERHLFSLNTSTGDGQALTTGLVRDVRPWWGTERCQRQSIAFVRTSDLNGDGQIDSRDGPANIWLMDADGHNARNLTHSASDEFDPAISPDGNWIVFTRGVSPNTDIFVMSIDGSNIRQLTFDITLEAHPVWVWPSNVPCPQSAF